MEMIFFDRNYYRVLCKLVIVFCFCGAIKCQTSEDETCLTPTKELGSCISIKSCAYLRNKFQDVPKPLNSENILTLHSYHCGFDLINLKVCCPRHQDSNPFSGNEPSSNSGISGINEINSVRIPPNRFGIGNHPNLRLINRNNCGGKIPGLSQYPWMALLAYDDGKNGLQFRCGGSLINENYILTTAHCISHLKTVRLAGVRLGEYDIRTEIDCYNQKGCAPPVTDFTVSEIIPHPSYNPNTLDNDIGLLRLSRPANVNSETVKPICLPTSQEDYEDLVGQSGIVTGWGVTESGFTSSILLKISIPIISNRECQTRYSDKKTGVLITDYQICAGGTQGKDSCSGDGGSPLGLETPSGIFVQHGIVSFGSRFCGMGNLMLPGVYTKVYSYMSWILDNIRE